MPWGERAKRFLSKGNYKKDKRTEKESDNTKQTTLKKNNEAGLAESGATTSETNLQPVQHHLEQTTEPVKGPNQDRHVAAIPVLKLPPRDTSNVHDNENNIAASTRELQKASPLGPNKQRLWDEAYDTLCKKEPGLVKAYQRDLLSLQTQDKRGMTPIILNVPVVLASLARVSVTIVY